MEVLLHINPNDQPTTGATSTLIFEFTDKKGRFSLENCDCQFTINFDEKPIFIKKSSDSDVTKKENEISFNFTFPHKGRYDVDVEGKPLSGEIFSEFGFDFDANVLENQTAATLLNNNHWIHHWGGHLIHIILFGTAIAISVIVIVRDFRKSKN